MSFLNDFMKQIATGDSVKDYAHGARTFTDSGLRLAPKSKFLYHVFFDITPGVSLSGSSQTIEAGMMVKHVELPKFNVDTKTLNAYNRKNVTQSNINYEPVTFTFHDDMANVVRDLWYDYYSYYYNDSGYGENTYTTAYKYEASDGKKWGYRNPALPFFKSIRIYQMHKKEFSEYILINPMITSWEHGDQDYSDSAPVEHRMRIEYETVKYSVGQVSSSTVKGFGDFHYDKTPSPLTPAGGGTNSIIGPGGLLDSVTDISTDLASGNLLGAAFKAVRGAENFSGADLKEIAVSELKTGIKDVVQGKNPLERFYFPAANLIGGAAPQISASQTTNTALTADATAITPAATTASSASTPAQASVEPYSATSYAYDNFPPDFGAQ